MKPSMRRLAKDQIGIRKALPPNYFFADDSDNQSLPEDLTQLLICLTGPEGTPYSQGVWRLRLDIPVEYPQNPPTATFQTRIFHPNVAEDTGAVCLETLKRDWDPRLTLKDILITISCLLIQPNPDSALNEKAGVLVRDDFDAFTRQARLMTKIHASIPPNLAELARIAKRRGDEAPESALSTISKNTCPTRASVIDNMSKENLPTDAVDTKRDQDGRILKRPLDSIYQLSEQTQSVGEESDSRVRRKSPKHSHHTDHSQSSSATKQHCDVEASSFTCHYEKEDDPSSAKVIFRTHWAPTSGKLKIKARIGIRRL